VSQRSDPRYEVNAYVDVAAQDVLLYHHIQNISIGGICIQTQSVDEVGAEVDVVINFPELGSQLALRGQIVWANRTPPADVGIRWVGLDEERRKQLVAYIERVKTRELSDR
jgi:Tfp pilus assembly protein PilZ